MSINQAKIMIRNRSRPLRLSQSPQFYDNMYMYSTIMWKTTVVLGFTWTSFFLFSFYPGNEFSKINLYTSSFDHRITKTYFFMHIFSDINAVISCKTEELSHFHL